MRLAGKPRSESRDRLRCSFCGKEETRGRKIIRREDGRYICSECADRAIAALSSEQIDNPRGLDEPHVRPQQPSLPEWTRWHPEGMLSAGPRSWDHGGNSSLIGPRQYAILSEPASEFEGPPGPWIVLLAHDQVRGRDTARVEAYLTFLTKDTVYGLRSLRGEELTRRATERKQEIQRLLATGDLKGFQVITNEAPPEDETSFVDLESAKRYFGASYYGRGVGEWTPVPDEIGRSLAQTIAWLVARAAAADT